MKRKLIFPFIITTIFVIIILISIKYRLDPCGTIFCPTVIWLALMADWSGNFIVFLIKNKFKKELKELGIE
ncbi:MAG: hypothetical protein NT068_04255 [Candidatus Nomurabacteria bacterium]|nr:hypothetical protein [Candidatus Nomurabacteria bacterium]